MNVRHALLASLATLSAPALAGCTGYPCDPGEEDFDLDEPLTVAQVDEMVETYYGSDGTWEDLTCNRVCQSTYSDLRGWSADEITSCALTLPSLPEEGGADGNITCSGRGLEFVCKGRRPLNVVADPPESNDRSLGSTFAAMAYLERISVDAFEELAVQLARLDAPETLIQRCEAAADDERRHATWAEVLARRYGGASSQPIATDASMVPERREGCPDSKVTLLREIAAHNAVEGCVHECFAALWAAVQGRHAPNLVLRALFTRIAADELRHGQLAWDLHVWFQSQLGREEAEHIDQLQRAALRDLPRRAAESHRHEAPQLIGLDASAIAQLATQLADQLAA